MYELIAIWFFCIALLSMSMILITLKYNYKTQVKTTNFTLVNYIEPQVNNTIVLADKPQNILLLSEPVDYNECGICPICKKHNMANPNLELTSYLPNYDYFIPLEPKHKYRTANIEPLCKICVDKLHKQIDNALDGKLDNPVTYGGSLYTGNGKIENLECEFELLIDGISVYKGYDYKVIKPLMANRKPKTDKYATSWLSIADIQQPIKGSSNVLINGNAYKVTYREAKPSDMPKIINGLKAINIEYVISATTNYKGNKRYIVAERIQNKVLECVK